ncbi:MAG: leucyl aminopeptidase, partial [Bacteroidales bacterium]|nr:leucyl aminopeptidase [Bacteroidales bacterium]
MMIQLKNSTAEKEAIHKLLIFPKNVSGDLPGLNAEENKWVLKQRNDLKKELITLERYPVGISLLFLDQETDENKRLESCRKHGFSLGQYLNKNGLSKLEIIPEKDLDNEALAVAEGMALGNYQFLKYRKDQKEKQNSLSEIHLISNAIDQKLVDELNIIIEANHWARDLVNEP